MELVSTLGFLNPSSSIRTSLSHICGVSGDDLRHTHAYCLAFVPSYLSVRALQSMARQQQHFFVFQIDARVALALRRV